MTTQVNSQLEAQSEKKKYCTLYEGVVFLLGFLKNYKVKSLWALYFHFADLLPFVLLPLVTMVIVDYFIPSSNVPAILWSLVAVITLVGLNVLFHCSFKVAISQVMLEVSRDIRNTIIRRLQMLSLSYHNKHPTGRYYSKIMTDVDNIQNFAIMVCGAMLSMAGVIIFGISVLAYINWRVLCLMLLFVPVFQLITQLFKRHMRRNQFKARKARENLSSIVGNFLQASLLARMHGHEAYESCKVDSGSQVVSEKVVEAEAASCSFLTANNLCMHTFNYIGIAICAISVIHETITFGEMMVFTAYIAQIMGQFNMLMGMFPQIVMFTESVSSIKEILNAPDIEYNTGKRKLRAVEGDIRFENVSFAYDAGERKVLEDVSVSIEKGMTVGLVGKSGSGKSTFINLALGLYRTNQGIVSIDEQPINSLDMQTVRQHIGVVNQSPVLFSGSIHENIIHAYRDTPFESVVEAAKKANAHDFIMEQPDGYDTEVGEQGVLLSGGQKQRIALARTILRNPSILVLDEATSALDSESEKLVQQAIDNLDKQMTKLVIAHRLSTIRNADIILVFDQGRIIEKGSHQELVKLNGHYSNLLMYQSLDPLGSEEDLKSTVNVKR